MTGGVNCGGGRRAQLRIVGVLSSGAPPHIYRLEGRRGSQGGAPSRRNPTWAPPNSASPLTISIEGGRKEEGGGKEGGGRSLPFLMRALIPLLHPQHLLLYILDQLLELAHAN